MHYRRRQPPSIRIGNHIRNPSLNHCHQGVGRPKINTHNQTHVPAIVPRNPPQSKYCLRMQRGANANATASWTAVADRNAVSHNWSSLPLPLFGLYPLKTRPSMRLTCMRKAVEDYRIPRRFAQIRVFEFKSVGPTTSRGPKASNAPIPNPCQSFPIRRPPRGHQNICAIR